MKLLITISLFLVGCGGKIASQIEEVNDNWYGGACQPPESLCSPEARGSYICANGSVAYYCCGYTSAELNRLAMLGDEFAQNCTHPMPSR